MNSTIDPQIVEIKRSSYFSCPPIASFAFGEVIKVDLNLDGHFTDICVIIGIRFERDDNLWIYRVRMIISLEFMNEEEELNYQPGDEMEVSDRFIKYLTLEDLEAFSRTCDRYLSELELA